MKFHNGSNSPSSQDMAEMLSKMKTLLIDVLLEKCLPDGSRIKLKDCISMVEFFSNFLNNIEKQEQNSENFLKPLHSGLSRSTECLNVKKNQMFKSRSTSDIANFDLNKNDTCLPKIAFDNDHSDYVISAESAEQMSDSQTQSCETAQCRTMERRATKKRIKMLRWLKKAIVVKGQDDVTVIGDIYKIEGPNNHMKLWCLLRDRQLYCYRSVTDTTPDSVIALDNCIAAPSDCTLGQKYAFHVEKDGIKLATFAARSSKERARWIEIVKKKRGKYPLMEIGQESEEDSTGSGTSSEDDDDSHEYVEVDDVKSAAKSNPEPTYVLAMSDSEDAGYISVLALECEIDRRRTCRKEKKYNPYITNKCGIEHLAEMDKPSFLSTLPKDMSLPVKHRSPAPLPKDATVLSSKIQGEVSKGVPALHLDKDGEREPGDGVDLNNNDDVDSLEKEVFLGECADDEEILSLEHKGILRCQLTASSWLSDSPPCQARLGLRPNGSENATGAWRPEKDDKTQFLEIDLGDVVTVGAITIMGRPDFDEKGGEFVKSFTLQYSIDKETWTPYKSHGKIKVFQGVSSATQECKKYFKNKTSAQYFRIYPQSWQNHIALRVAFYKDDVKSKGMKKKGDKSGPTSPLGDHPQSPNMRRKVQLTKEDISDPMYPSSDCLKTEVCDLKENVPKHPNTIETSLDSSDNPTSMESRIKLREKLLSKEKREQITKLAVLKQHVDQAKDRMIVVNTSGQLKREAIESEHDYLVANLELVKAKKRLIDIEAEMRELRLFGEKYNGEQQKTTEEENPEELAKPADEAKSTEVAKTIELASIIEAARRIKPPLKRRLSKEVMMYTDAVSPEVDQEGFNSPGDPPPPRKVMDNVKLFEKLQKIP